MPMTGRQDFQNCLCWLPDEDKNFYGFPEIKGIKELPESDTFMNSEFARRNKEYNNWVMFFEYDYKFERMWQQPKRQAKWLQNFKGAVSPNFSVYMDTPIALQIMSIYKSRWCGAYWESLGIPVIPNVLCGDRTTYDFAFDGLPKNSVVAVNNVGCMKDEYARYWCYRKIEETFKRLDPSLLLIYGTKMDGLDGANIRYIK